MSHRTEEERSEIKSITPYRAQTRRPLVWLVQKVEANQNKSSSISHTSPALGAPARELESTDLDSRSGGFRLAA